MEDLISRQDVRTSQQDTRISHLLIDNDRLNAEAKRVKVSEYSRYTEIVIADAITKIYGKVWNFIIDASTDLP